MEKNEKNSSSLIKISQFKRLEINNPKTFFHLIYTFPNNDYLLESLQYTKDFKNQYQIRKKFQIKMNMILN